MSTARTNDAPAANNQALPADSMAAFRMDLLGGADAAEAGASAPPRTRRHTQAFLVAAVAVAAGGALLAMRHFGMGPRSSMAGPVVDLDVVGPEGAPKRDADDKRVLHILDTSSSAIQVPPDQVQKNPFRLAGALSSLRVPAPDGAAGAAKPAGPTDEELRRKAMADRRKAIDTSLATLQVQTVIAGGAVPVARINNQTLRVGDTLEDLFTVVAIEGRGVRLKVDDEEFFLEMTNGAPGSSAPHAPVPPVSPKSSKPAAPKK